MGSFYNIVIDFGEAIAAFVAMLETRQNSAAKELNTTIMSGKWTLLNRKISLPPLV